MDPKNGGNPSAQQTQTPQPQNTAAKPVQNQQAPASPAQTPATPVQSQQPAQTVNTQPLQNQQTVTAPPEQPQTSNSTSQNSNTVFTQSSDTTPPVPSQSVQQPSTPAAMPPPPPKRGGFIKKLFMFLIIVLLLGGISAGALIFLVGTGRVSINESLDNSLKAIATSVGIASEDSTEEEEEIEPEESPEAEETQVPVETAEPEVEEDIEDSLFIEVEEVQESPEPEVNNLQIRRRDDLSVMLAAIIEFYDANGFLPDTDNDSSVQDFPDEWTCIGTAPQCYDLEEAGQETTRTIVPDYMDEVRIDPEIGFKQETGYEINYDEETKTLTIRSVADNSISVDGTLE